MVSSAEFVCRRVDEFNFEVSVMKKMVLISAHFMVMKYIVHGFKNNKMIVKSTYFGAV